jgi:single-stranded DNA-binding protein
VLAFAETARAELMRLTDGDALSVQGALKAETYEKDGATRLSLSVVADHVLALRQPRRVKKANPETDARRPEAPAFDDSIPFYAGPTPEPVPRRP